MIYRDPMLSFSFELPDGWRHDPQVRPLTFLGPRGRVGAVGEHIQIRTEQIAPRYRDPAERERFMAEPGATVTRGRLGTEENVVVCEWADHAEITVVRDDVHYSLVFPNDAETIEAVRRLRDTFEFPPASVAFKVIQERSDPAVQTMVRVTHAGSAEEARRILEASPALESIEELPQALRTSCGGRTARRRKQREDGGSSGSASVKSRSRVPNHTAVQVKMVAEARVELAAPAFSEGRPRRRKPR